MEKGLQQCLVHTLMNWNQKRLNYASCVLFEIVGVIVVSVSGVKARGRPRRAWTDDLKNWTELRNYSELKRTAEDRTIWNVLARQPST